MPFNIPNFTAATYAGQSEIDSVDFEILTAANKGTGVVSGCTVTAQGTPNMTVAVAAGTALVNGTSVSVSAGSTGNMTADATNGLYYLVSVNSSGTIAITAGTATTTPVFPAIPANSVVLASVYLPANATSVTSGQIIDKRVLITNYEVTPSTQAIGDSAAAGTAATLSRGDHKHGMPSSITAAQVSGTALVSTDATSTNTASKVVQRDSSGNFAAGTITATTFTASTSVLIGSGTVGTLSTAAAVDLGTASAGTATTTARADHIHRQQLVYSSTAPSSTDIIWVDTSLTSAPIFGLEQIATITATSGTITYNYASAPTFYHTASPTADWTVNFTNLLTTNNYGYNLTIIVPQGTAAAKISAVQIDGVAQTIKWAGSTAAPPGNNSKTDFWIFTLIRISGAWTVYGVQSANFG